MDGQQGLEALMARSYDFVLCDIDMPNLNGLECIQQLRAWEEEHRPHKRQTVFCMTGEDKLSDEVIKRVISIFSTTSKIGFGPKSFCSKPTFTLVSVLKSVPDFTIQRPPPSHSLTA